MIKFINEQLFKITTEKVEHEKGDYFKSDVITAMNVVKGRDAKNSGKLLITKIIASNEDYNTSNTAVNVMTLESGKKKVSIKSSDRNKYDSRIFMIAIPYNGFAEPIEHTNLYRIHKGLIAKSSKRNIVLEKDGQTYKKVLYLMVTLNEAVFLEEHKYHTDEIVLKFVTYNLESRKNEDTSETVNETVKTTVFITFTKDGASYNTFSETVSPVNAEDFVGKRIFTVFEKKPYVPKKGDSEKSYVNKNDEEQEHDNKLDLEDMIAKYQKDASYNEKSRNKKNGKRKRR